MTTTYWADKELHIHSIVKGLGIDDIVKQLDGILKIVTLNLTSETLSDSERLHQIEFRLIIEDYLDFYRNRQDKIRRSLELETPEYSSASLAQWKGGVA